MKGLNVEGLESGALLIESTAVSLTSSLGGTKFGWLTKMFGWFRIRLDGLICPILDFEEVEDGVWASPPSSNDLKI